MVGFACVLVGGLDCFFVFVFVFFYKFYIHLFLPMLSYVLRGGRSLFSESHLSPKAPPVTACIVPL